jgi:hypothetical protein
MYYETKIATGLRECGQESCRSTWQDQRRSIGEAGETGTNVKRRAHHLASQWSKQSRVSLGAQTRIHATQTTERVIFSYFTLLSDDHELVNEEAKLLHFLANGE